jgi:group I intron endonuclease
MKKIGVYKIVSPEGLVYIGQSANLHKRLLNYKTDNKSYNSPIRQSIRKHGFDNHIFEILQECEKSMLDQIEKHYINSYDSFNNGLNFTSGGKVGYIGSPETYKKVSESLKGKQRTFDVRQKISQSHLSNSYIITNQTRFLMSESAKGNSSHSKKVKVTIGFEYAIFNSLKESAIALNITREYLSRFVNGLILHPDFKIEYI